MPPGPLHRAGTAAARFTLGTSVLLLPSPLLAAEFPLKGGYGFDWLKPEAAACRRISEHDLARFRRCEFSADGHAFGLPFAYHTCVAEPGSEVLIYATPCQCREALETMRSNAP
jgi:hypothetical protein